MSLKASPIFRKSSHIAPLYVYITANDEYLFFWNDAENHIENQMNAPPRFASTRR